MKLVMESKINALDKQIASVESKIDIQEGEAVRLNAELNRRKESLRAAMAFYKRAIKDLERAALELTKAKKKYSNRRY